MEKLFQRLTALIELPMRARYVHKFDCPIITPYYAKYTFIGCKMDFR